MGILSWLLFGLIAGIIAKILHRGDDPDGWIITIIIGIVGAFVGGAIAKFLFGWQDATEWNWHSYVSSVGGAILVLVIYKLATKRRS